MLDQHIFKLKHMIQYNLPTPALVYSGFLSNPAKNSGPNNFPMYLNVKNTSVIRILWIPNSGLN